MNIIELLRKVGILRIGGGTFEGKVGGEFATIDMDRGGSPAGRKDEAGEGPPRDQGAGPR